MRGVTLNPDVARCSNEECPKRSRCARFDPDANYCDDFAIGIDGKCEGYISKARKDAVGSEGAAGSSEGRAAGKVKPWIGAI